MPLKKTDFPFPRKYQPEIASWLEVGLVSIFILFCWGFVWFEPMCVLCVCFTDSEFTMLVSIVVSGQCCFLGVTHDPWFQSFSSSSVLTSGP